MIEEEEKEEMIEEDNLLKNSI